MEFHLFANEIDDLVEFMTKNKWPYHRNIHVDKQDVLKAIEEGYYEDERETFWIMEKGSKIGLIIINDINDSIPIIDIRFNEAERGRGKGVVALKWLQHYLFSSKEKIRIEGYTRSDNLPMRKCFVRAGFVKEGYLRSSWENADGTISDTIIFGAIKEDWKRGTTTQISWHDLPY